MKVIHLSSYCASFALAFLLTGCFAVGPEYKKPQPDLPPAWHSLESQQTGKQALNEWWRLFNDPELTRLIDRTREANQDLQIAATRLKEARAARKIAGSRQLPSLGTSAGHTRTRSYENTSSGTVDIDMSQIGFDASWEIDVFGGVRRSVEASEARFESAEEALRDAQVQIIAETARNYLELRGAQQRLAIARENLAIQEETVHIIRERCELGFSTEMELEQASNQLNMTRSMVPGLEAATHLSIHQLTLLTNQGLEKLDGELANCGTIPLSPPTLPALLPSELLRQRPDIRRSERELAAATADIGVATADLFPRFSLSALAGLESSGLSDLVSSASRFWTAGPKISWPLFDGGRLRATKEITEAAQERAKITYERTVLAALVDTENSLTLAIKEQETNRHLQAAAVSGRKASQLARNQFQLGTTNFLSVLQSEYARQQTEDQLVQSQQRLATTMVALYKALGGGWEVPDDKEKTSVKYQTK